MIFENMGLRPELVHAVGSMGFDQATPIQQKVIPQLIDGRTDLVGLAQTGTGKTAAFGLPLLHLTDPKHPAPQGLVLCPTRELCLQITADLTRFAQRMPKLSIAAVYGGANIVDQMRRVRRAQIIVATPGRLRDLMIRKAMVSNHIAYVVLDEADEMLSMGFQEDIDDILGRLPAEKQTWLFSATMPPAATKIAAKYMHKPIEISADSRSAGAEGLEHTCYVVKEKDRYAALKRLIDYVPDIYGLIFCRTRLETRSVAERLMKEGYSAEALHGDLSQEQRNYVMGKFREGTLQILVATDVAARGLDVDDITHVIHYKLPDEADRYIHRSGRTARAGKTGASFLLVNTHEARRIPDLERRTGARFTIGRIPQGKAICEKQLFTMVDKLAKVQVKHREIDGYLPPVYEALGALSKEELIQRFVSVEFNRFLDYYRDTGDLNATRKKSTPKKYGSGGRSSKTKTPHANRRNTRRFFINVGRLDKIKEGAIVRLVCDTAGIRSDKIGQIALKREFSFFDVDQRVAAKVLNSMQGAKLDNRMIEVKYADRNAERRRKRKERRQ